MNRPPSCASIASETDSGEEVWDENELEVLSEVSTEDECLAESKKKGMLVPAKKEFLDIMNTPPWKQKRANSMTPLSTLVEAQTQVFVAFKERCHKKEQTTPITIEDKVVQLEASCHSVLATSAISPASSLAIIVQSLSFLKFERQVTSAHPL
ncbi:hypothetical protein QR680_001532 [Steinernema hermaphroditum]|uniref:Uncharacterized protein n=1 Tax=Steinernema hermaphroditum TaxID=289476 RepID=A0AA39GZK3_9BILA|nr:hypothetical protein QR680_001532 [Steinernema hermaphroditum]